jgi:tRNA A-37 threonylcarbamoyl transferase component Bud32
MNMLRKKIGNFYLIEKLGSGGMSEVFLGINPKTREKRAFKIMSLRASRHASSYARFQREVQIIRGLNHQSIIRIMDNGILEDFYYYSMEYMPGGNLNRRIERGRIPISEAVGLFVSMCDAMAYSHERAIIHRDLKPSNILLNAEGDPVVSDFGIAKLLDSSNTSLTQSGEILGTIAYLAPEQRFNTKKVNRKADVYALGAIFYEMLMGFPPLGKFPWPREVQTDFPESLQTVLEKCLVIDPENRLEHAGVLMLELEKCPEIKGRKAGNVTIEPSARKFSAIESTELVPAKTDRIELWFHVLRTGTTRERLAAVREMIDQITPAEAKAVLKIYPEEGDRVRWGVIRVLGELKIEAATMLILRDMNNPFLAECSIEALGKIGADVAYSEIRKYVIAHPEIALIAMLPMAKAGKEKAVKDLSVYLDHGMAVLRQAAIQALASIPSMESLCLLRERMSVEHDEKVRASLFQAVHSLQAILVAGIAETTHNSETIYGIRSL